MRAEGEIRTDPKRLPGLWNSSAPAVGRGLAARQALAQISGAPSGVEDEANAAGL